MDEIAEEVIAITSNHEIEIEKNFKLIGAVTKNSSQPLLDIKNPAQP